MPDTSWIRRQPTLLPGRPIAADRLYLITALAGSFLTSAAFAMYGLFAVREAQLTPLQLVLVGTALEATVFVFEIPTGVVADAVSRRFSMLIGYFLFGLGPLVMGIWPSWEGLLAGHIIWGLGWTFLSGAREAWLADEVGEAAAARLYPLAAQWRQLPMVAGVVAGVGLSFVDLRVPFILFGVIEMGFVFLVLFTMTEAGYAPVPRGERSSWRQFASTAAGGLRAIRGSTLLVAALVITFLFGLASESFDRLWPYQLVENIGVPGDFDEVVVFGAIAIVGQLGAILAIKGARMVNQREHPLMVVRTLFVTYVVIIGSLAAFAVTDSFVVGLLAIWILGWARAVKDPFFIGWINRGLNPATRATVLSTVSQGDAIGQVAGGPIFGTLAAIGSVRIALGASAAVIVPAALVMLGQSARARAEGVAAEEEAKV